MKIFGIHFLLCVFAGECLSSPSIKAQSATAMESEQLLVSNEPMREPVIERNTKDPEKRKSAETLFRAELQAIYSLYGSKEPAAVDALIPYLHYSPYNTFTFTAYNPAARLDVHPNVGEISDMFPAFGAILSNPAAAQQLEKYVLYTEHPIKDRFAAIHVLRYVDKKRFQVVVAKLEQELAQAGPMTRGRLEAIKNKEAPFEVSNSIQMDR